MYQSVEVQEEIEFMWVYELVCLFPSFFGCLTYECMIMCMFNIHVYISVCPCMLEWMRLCWYMNLHVCMCAYVCVHARASMNGHKPSVSACWALTWHIHGPKHPTLPWSPAACTGGCHDPHWWSYLALRWCQHRTPAQHTSSTSYYRYLRNYNYIFLLSSHTMHSHRAASRGRNKIIKMKCHPQLHGLKKSWQVLPLPPKSENARGSDTNSMNNTTGNKYKD